MPSFLRAAWDRRSDIVPRFADQRLKLLAHRLIYFESPHLLEEADRRVIPDDIAARRRGEGNYESPSWRTIRKAATELDKIEARVALTTYNLRVIYER